MSQPAVLESPYERERKRREFQDLAMAARRDVMASTARRVMETEALLEATALQLPPAEERLSAARAERESVVAARKAAQAAFNVDPSQKNRNASLGLLIDLERADTLLAEAQAAFDAVESEVSAARRAHEEARLDMHGARASDTATQAVLAERGEAVAKALQEFFALADDAQEVARVNDTEARAIASGLGRSFHADFRQVPSAVFGHVVLNFLTIEERLRLAEWF